GLRRAAGAGHRQGGEPRGRAGAVRDEHLAPARGRHPHAADRGARLREGHAADAAALSRGRHHQMKRAWRACVAGVATLPMAMTLASAAAAAQPDIDALVSEIEQLPREAFDADPRRWQEVFDLLEELLAARQPIGRGAAAPADAAAAQD